MVQHGVQRQRHFAFVQGVGQAFEGFFAAKHGVDVEEVGGVVLVVAGGGEDGREVHAGYAQIGQVVELGDDAIQVATEKLVAPGFVERGLVPFTLDGARQVVGRVGQFLRAAQASANGKALGEDLVDDLAGGVAGKGVEDRRLHGGCFNGVANHSS